MPESSSLFNSTSAVLPKANPGETVRVHPTGARIFPLGQSWAEGRGEPFRSTSARIAYNEEGITFTVEGETAFPFALSSRKRDDVIVIFLHDPRTDFHREWRFAPGSEAHKPKSLEMLGDATFRDKAMPINSRSTEVFIPWQAFSADAKRPPCLRWAVCRYDYSGAGPEGAPVLSSTAALSAPDFLRRHEWNRLDFDGAGGRNGFLWINALHVVIGEHGSLPRRVSPGLLEEMTDSEKAVARMTAGIEVQFDASSARGIRIRFRIVHDDGFPVTWALFLRNQKRHPTRTVAEGSRHPQEIAWTLPRNGTKNQPIRLIFPTHAEIELLSVELESEPPVDAPAAPMRAGLPRWLAHGDSITHGANVTSPDFTWVELVARQLLLAPFNLGFGANARAQEYIAREIAARDDWDLLSLHLGTNSMSTPPNRYRQAYDRFLDVIRQAHPAKPIVCVTPIIHSSDNPARDADDPDERNLKAETIRKVIREAVLARAVRDPHLHLIEGTELLSDLDQLLSDGTHPSDHGAAAIARELAARLAPIVSRMTAPDDRGNKNTLS